MYDPAGTIWNKRNKFHTQLDVSSCADRSEVHPASHHPVFLLTHVAGRCLQLLTDNVNGVFVFYPESLPYPSLCQTSQLHSILVSLVMVSSGPVFHWSASQSPGLWLADSEPQEARHRHNMWAWPDTDSGSPALSEGGGDVWLMPVISVISFTLTFTWFSDHKLEFDKQSHLKLLKEKRKRKDKCALKWTLVLEEKTWFSNS